MFHFLWYNVLYQPLYNLLIAAYFITPKTSQSVGDMGFAVIFLTILIRLVLLPLSIRSARSEHRLERLQPVFDQIKIRYRYNIEKQRKALRMLLRQNDIGIFSNVFSLLFQILFFIVLYSIFSSGLQLGGHNVLYPFVPRPAMINPYFLGRLNLTHPNQMASIVAGLVVLFQQSIRRVKNITDASFVDKALLFGLPIGTYLLTFELPASKSLFIITSVIFSLWIRLIRIVIVKFFIKDEQLKANIADLWTN